MRRVVLFSALCFATSAWAQLLPRIFTLSRAVIDSSDSSMTYMVDSTSFAGLASNGIIDIQGSGDSLLFFGTSGGVSITPDLGLTFRSYLQDVVNLPAGGISALGVYDSIIVVAGVKDTTVGSSREIMGTGLAYSTDRGNSWTYLSQPVDVPGSDEYISYSWGGNTIRRLAVTTAINNITYDVSVTPDYIWAASWAGGLRRFSFATGEWFAVPLPEDTAGTLTCADNLSSYTLNPRDPRDGGNHNHKGFSVIAYGDTVWVGTAAGINRGILEAGGDCISWVHYKAQWDNISGNFVVGLHRQVLPDGKERIWAATLNAEDLAERRAVSYTSNDGENWKITLEDKRPYNISSSGTAIFASTSDGLYKSFDGLNWARFSAARDDITGERVWAEQVYTTYSDARDTTLWLGTSDGLAKTQDDGRSWAIQRSFVSTQRPDENRFYAYPNPFYPAENNVLNGLGHVRFQYHTTVPEASAKISIFNFAMEQVVKLAKQTHVLPGDYSQVWDGRNSDDMQVANGVYYCRLALETKSYWTKVIVIN